MWEGRCAGRGVNVPWAAAALDVRGGEGQLQRPERLQLGGGAVGGGGERKLVSRHPGPVVSYHLDTVAYELYSGCRASLLQARPCP